MFATITEELANELTVRLKASDPTALAGLYVAYGRPLLTVIRHIVPHREEAEDILHESYLRAWNRRDQLSETRGSVSQWLTGIARNCALDYRKSAASRLEVFPETDDSFPISARIEDRLLDLDRTRALMDALHHLPIRERRVIELAYYDGLHQPAIAERLHAPLGTVKSWTRSALQHLRSTLESPDE